MPPALEIYHVPPEGRGAGRFVARLEAVGASGPDEDGEPSDEVYVAYELDSLKRIVLFHTWTPSALRGKGLAARVCEEAFAWAEANDVRVVPECSYVSDTFLAKRKDLERLVDR
jgi:predicted GNAT family acetyltransferase